MSIHHPLRESSVEPEQDGIWQRGEVALLDFLKAQTGSAYMHDPRHGDPWLTQSTR